MDPSTEDPYWLQIFRYRLEDGNGDSIDEQLIVVKVEERTGNISLKPASLFLDIVPSNNRDPVPRLPRDIAMLTTETVEWRWKNL